MTEETADRSRHRAWHLLALVLAAIQAVLLARTAWDKSDTADEPYYLATSVMQWEGDFSGCDAPALPKWGFGLALRLADPPIFDADQRLGRHPLWSRPSAVGRRNLMAARVATTVVTVGAGLLLYAVALPFGPGAAAVGHALWCFSPSVLASGALATLDAWATAFSVLAIWTVACFIRKPTPLRAACVGASLALAASCKITTLALVPVACLIATWAVLRSRAPEAGPRASWAALVRTGMAAASAFLITLWAPYGFSFGWVNAAVPCRGVPADPGDMRGPFPFAPWIEGILHQFGHGSQGHMSYLFGEVRSDGWWWFYLACFAFKTTLGAQALAVALVIARWRRRSAFGSFRLDAAILAFPAVVLMVMSLGKAQGGIKYVLPVFPFLMLWAARSVGALAAGLTRLSRLAILAALAIGTGESLARHPHHLMFFNLWAGGPEGGPRYLVLGDDWGQDQRRLGEWQAQMRPWKLYYTPYVGQPLYWGISAEPPPCEPQPGYYALHAVEVHRPKRLPRGCLDWLTVEPPDDRIGYSIYLYLVNRARIARLASERGRIPPFWRSGRD